MEASLKFEGPEAGRNLYEREYVVDKPEVTFGRASDNDIQVPTAPIFSDVSRRHCSFYSENCGLLFRDYSSKGTLINGESALPGVVTHLNPGDELTFGNHLRARVVIKQGLLSKLKSFFS